MSRVILQLVSCTGNSGETSSGRVPIAMRRRLRMADAARKLRRRSTPSEAVLWLALGDRRLDRYRFLRISADRVLHGLPSVLAEIRAALAASPPLPQQGRRRSRCSRRAAEG